MDRTYTAPNSHGEDKAASMPAAAEPDSPPSGVEVKVNVRDDRRPSWGLGRIVMALFWFFGVITTIPAVVSLIRDQQDPLGPRLVAVLAGIVYLLAAIGITHNGHRMRLLAWGSMAAALVGPLVVGLLGLGMARSSPVVSAWADFGAFYWYFPLLLPLIGLVWLWRSDPRRIVIIAEGIERPRRFPWHDG